MFISKSNVVKNMKKNKLVLDRFFSHVKWVTKRTTQFVIVIFVLFAIVVGSSNPILHGAQISSNQTHDLYFSVVGSEQTQIGFFAFDPNDNDQAIHLALSLFVWENGTWQLYDTNEIWIQVHIQFLGLERGDYRLQITNLSPTMLEVHLVTAQASPNLLIALVAAIICFTFFWIIIQFALPIYLILLMVSLVKEEVVVHTGEEPPKVTEGQQESIRPTFRPIQSKNNILGVSNDDITTNNKIGLIIASLLLLISFLTSAFPLAFFGGIIMVSIIAEIYSANKLRIRVLNLMNNPPFPHSKPIATVAKLAESTPDKVEKLVKRLILDLGYPLELDMESKTITALEPLGMFLSTVNERVYSRSGYTPPLQNIEIQDEGNQTIFPPVTASSTKYCIKCGLPLPLHAVYCYECGTKND